MIPALHQPAVIGAVLPSGLRCECGEANVAFISPGHEPKEFGNSLFTYERGEPVRAWCLACHPMTKRRAA